MRNGCILERLVAKCKTNRGCDNYTHYLHDQHHPKLSIRSGRSINLSFVMLTKLENIN